VVHAWLGVEVFWKAAGALRAYDGVKGLGSSRPSAP
jgi:hypothetical protein